MNRGRGPDDRPVVLFVAAVAGFKGGAERSLLDLCANPAITPLVAVPAPGPLSEALRAAGVPVRIIAFGRAAEVGRGLGMAAAARAIPDAIRASAALAKLSRQCGATLVHSNGLKPHVIAGLARLLGGAPVIVHLRDAPHSLRERIIWRAIAACAARTFLVSRCCWPGTRLPKRVSIVPNGIREAPTVQARHAGPLQLGYVGRIHPWKGLHRLLDWTADARDAGISLHLRVRGEPAPEDRAYGDQLREQVAARRLAGLVSFDGFLPDTEQAYEGLDALAVPSILPDPLPRVVLEAQSRGIPVIAAGGGGLDELVEHGRTGWRADSSAQFVQALRQIVECPDEADRIVRHALEICRTRFSLAEMHRRVTAVYAQVWRAA